MQDSSVALPTNVFYAAAVSCSLGVYTLGGVRLWFWLTGRLGRAWRWCMVCAWVPGGGDVGGGVVVVLWWWDNCMCIPCTAQPARQPKT